MIIILLWAIIPVIPPPGAKDTSMVPVAGTVCGESSEDGTVQIPKRLWVKFQFYGII